jgi:putative membrane protein
MVIRGFLATGVLSAAVAVSTTGCAVAPAGEPMGAPIGAQPGAQPAIAAGNMFADYEALYTGTLEGARFAHGHTQNEALRAYSQRLIDDYTTAEQRMGPLMQRHGITATPGTTTEALQRNFRESAGAARNLQGADFDRHWLDHNIAMNRWLLENIDRSYAPGVARHPELQTELNTLRTTIQGHLQEAERLRAGIQ